MNKQQVMQAWATALQEFEEGREPLRLRFKTKSGAIAARHQLYRWRKEAREKQGLLEGYGPYDGFTLGLSEHEGKWLVSFIQEEDFESSVPLCEGSEGGTGETHQLASTEALPSQVPQSPLEEAMQQASQLEELRRAPEQANEDIRKLFGLGELSEQERLAEPKRIEKDGIVWQPTTPSAMGARPPQTEAERRALEEYERTGRSRAVPLQAQEDGEPDRGQEKGS